MKVVNECRIDFKYRLSPKSYIINKTIFSNVVSTQIIENTLELQKYVNKTETTSLDILVYTISISNISSFTVTNIFLQDKIPKGTKFIENSVKVNDLKRRRVNPDKGFALGNLKSGEEVKVDFKVLVLPVCLQKPIKNHSSIEYDYIYNIEENPIRVNKNSNNVKTRNENRLFKQISVGKTVKTNNYINKIIDSKCKVRIIKTKVMNNLKSNLCTLVVIGKIEYKMCYKSSYHTKYIEDVFGFSSCMLVPIGINYSNKDKIKLNTEYVSIDLINKNTAFVNANLLLYY